MALRSFSKLALLFAGCMAGPAIAQTLLPKVDVNAHQREEQHGGYLISSDFKVDPHIPAVVYPAEPLETGDILSVRLTQMKDDEYFILQECVANPCIKAHILRAWNAYGALDATAHQPDRVWIPHTGKFFMWMQHIPMSGSSTGPFTGYEPLSPPMVFNPTGTAEQFHATDVSAAQAKGPERVVATRHDGLSYVIRFDSGTSVLIQRMHAAK